MSIFVSGSDRSNYLLKSDVSTPAPSFLGTQSNIDTMQNQKEIWKDIEGYEGLYHVSNLGRVKSFKLHNGIKERILKPGIDSNGYPIVCLRNVVSKTLKVHRLVLLAFKSNPENKPTVNHKKGIKIDNRASQLEWATYSENQLHAYKIGIMKPNYLGKFGKDHPLSKPVLQFTKDWEFIHEYAAMSEAERKTGIGNSEISKACMGKQKTAGGFKWKIK